MTDADNTGPYPFQLSRPPDGTILCCICFTYRHPVELFVDAAGTTWDLCAKGTCAKEAGYRHGTWPEQRKDWQ